jgi:hypothetical protein
MPGIDSVSHNVYRWERGNGEPSGRYKLHYCWAFGIPPEEFGSAPLPRPPSDTAVGNAADEGRSPAFTGRGVIRNALSESAALHLSLPSTVAYRGMQDANLGNSTVKQEVLMAAHDGSEHAERAERRDVGEATLEQLYADVSRLSVESMTSEPFPVFLDMRRVRARIFRLLDQQLWPGDQARLYFLLGCLSDLMAVAASGLGYPQAAEELIRSGWAYATAIDHKPLMAHLRLQLSSVLFWSNRFREARDVAADGLRYLTEGPNGAHLYVKYARASARIGDSDSAREAISAAREARERDQADDVLAVGGEFGLSLATQTYFAGSALADIEGAEGEAAAELELAASLYEAGPRADEQHWFGGKALASVDLATIRLRSGALDAASAALTPVLALPSSQRITSLTSRLDRVRGELARPIFSRSVPARELDERIEEFGRESVTAGLHSLPGGPA